MFSYVQRFLPQIGSFQPLKIEVLPPTLWFSISCILCHLLTHSFLDNELLILASVDFPSREIWRGIYTICAVLCFCWFYLAGRTDQKDDVAVSIRLPRQHRRPTWSVRCGECLECSVMIIVNGHGMNHLNPFSGTCPSVLAPYPTGTVVLQVWLMFPYPQCQIGMRYVGLAVFEEGLNFHFVCSSVPSFVIVAITFRLGCFGIQSQDRDRHCLWRPVGIVSLSRIIVVNLTRSSIQGHFHWKNAWVNVYSKNIIIETIVDAV